MVFVDSRKKSKKTLNKLYPNAILADVTSKATDALIKLSPFYPHGDIPIPYSRNQKAMSVEGIWQGLKVFENHDIDYSSFSNDKMKNIKRTIRKYGKPLGHRKGINGEEILDYVEARILIYLPSFLWVLENKVSAIINRLKEASQTKDIVLLDYATNGDIFEKRKPLSHAYLIKAYVEGNYPKIEESLLEYQHRKEKGIYKVEETKVSYLSEKEKNNDIPIEKILDFIKLKPKSSKEIINEFHLQMSSRKLTSILKKSKEFVRIDGTPLKFKPKETMQKKLF